jgi:hypothetical protein
MRRRYWHADAVTTLAFSASCLQLASASGCELAIWSPVIKAADKQKAIRSLAMQDTVSSMAGMYQLSP